MVPQKNAERVGSAPRAEAGDRNRFISFDASCQSNGSTFTIEAPWLLPTQSVGRGPVSCRNTRRILVGRGIKYSVIWPLLLSSRATRSLTIEPVQTCEASVVGTTS